MHHDVLALQRSRQRGRHQRHHDRPLGLLRIVLFFVFPCFLFRFLPARPLLFPGIDRDLDLRRQHLREHHRSPLHHRCIRRRLGRGRLRRRRLGRGGLVRGLTVRFGFRERGRGDLDRGDEGRRLLELFELERPVGRKSGLGGHRIDVHPDERRRFRAVLVLGRQDKADGHLVAETLHHEVGHRGRHPHERRERRPLHAATAEQRGEQGDRRHVPAPEHGHRM